MQTAHNPDYVLAHTQAWVAQAVVGLNLCPFAKAVQVKNQIRYVLSPATQVQALLKTLCAELDYLVQQEPEKIDTTLIVHPHVLLDFLNFNDFLEAAEAAIEQGGYSGVLQVASFHPQFQFAGTATDDITNATNQAPYPCLHILREASVERAVAAIAKPNRVFEANKITLEKLGSQGWADLQARCAAHALNSS
jgi:uncharacterized protein